MQKAGCRLFFCSRRCALYLPILGNKFLDPSSRPKIVLAVYARKKGTIFPKNNSFRPRNLSQLGKQSIHLGNRQPELRVRQVWQSSPLPASVATLAAARCCPCDVSTTCAHYASLSFLICSRNREIPSESYVPQRKGKKGKKKTE